MPLGHHLTICRFMESLPRTKMLSHTNKHIGNQFQLTVWLPKHEHSLRGLPSKRECRGVLFCSSSRNNKMIILTIVHLAFIIYLPLYVIWMISLSHLILKKKLVRSVVWIPKFQMRLRKSKYLIQGRAEEMGNRRNGTPSQASLMPVAGLLIACCLDASKCHNPNF